MLYEADLMGLDPLATLGIRLEQADPPVPAYAAELVEGVVAHRGELDALISGLAEGWTLGRMPAVDRNVLRLGAYELLHRPEVPPGVAVSEAVDLAGRLSTDESAAFVNGVLGGVLEQVAKRDHAASPNAPEMEYDSDGFDGAPSLG